jgi:hypothetical protein
MSNLFLSMLNFTHVHHLKFNPERYFITAYLKKLLHSQFVDTFIIHWHIKFNIRPYKQQI